VPFINNAVACSHKTSAGFKDKWCRIPGLSAGYSVSRSSGSDRADGEVGTAPKLVLSLSTRAASAHTTSLAKVMLDWEWAPAEALLSLYWPLERAGLPGEVALRSWQECHSACTPGEAGQGPCLPSEEPIFKARYSPSSEPGLQNS